MSRTHLARAALALTVVGCYAGLVSTAGPAAAAPAPAGAATATPPPAQHQPKYLWPQAHGDSQLTGVSADPSIGTTNAAGLGIKWMANLGAASLTSPIVGYNHQLGKTLVYAGSEGGWFSAFNAVTGQTVWSVDLGNPVRMTPTLDGPYIWVSDTYSPVLFKLDAATGAELCSTPIYAVAEASPIVATPPGGVETVYMGSNDLADSGPLYAINEANCGVEWSFTNYQQTTGLWDMISYGVDANGVPLVLFGTADPDAGIYALNAVTGKEVWHFQTYNPDDGPADVGAGVTISPPGNNGFADGVAYVASKDGKLYALDLTTGKKIWVNAFESFPPIGNGARDTASITGDNVVLGTTVGTFDVNAITGQTIWEQPFPSLPNEVLGAPAIAGPPGQQVVYTVNVDGQFQVLSLATGAILYTYQTSNYLASSPAVFSKNVVFTAANGFLYDFALGGGNTGSPSTAVTSPAQGSVVSNPNTATVQGKIQISGTATDSTGVSSVQVAVQKGGQTGTWWDKATKAWVGGVVDNLATLASPGATTTAWTLSVPVPAASSILEVRAAAVDGNHLADTSSDDSQSSPARVDFSVADSATAPTLQLSATRAGPGASLTATGGGYQPGEQVKITVPTSPVTTLATATADPNGALPSTAIVVPNPIDFGPTTLSAVGQTSGNTGTATLDVSNNWTQWGGSTSKNNFEQNDLALTNNVAAAGRFYFDEAYNFPTGAPIDSSVAIDQGIAYFGNQAGLFSALNVSTGAPLWQDSYGTGIDSSAAVDSSLMVEDDPEPAVFFGTEADTTGAGSVVAVDSQTGASLWTTPTTSGVDSSPAVYNGVVYVSTDDGTFYALNEQTGAVEWTEALAAATTAGIQSSPSIDPNHQTVVVGNGADVTAIPLAGGAPLWTTATGGPVTATPTYFSNNIYVGSQDHSEYALNGKTGAVLWSYATGGPITAGNVTFGTEIAVGSGDGTIYYLAAADGSLQNSLPGTTPVVGMSGGVNFGVATLANGTAIATRISGTDVTWKWVPGPGDGNDTFVSAPVVNNGNVYVTGSDDNLHVFTAPGRPVY